MRLFAGRINSSQTQQIANCIVMISAGILQR